MRDGVLVCDACGGRGLVYKSRGVRRYRRCEKCGRSWATVELSAHDWTRVAMLLDELHATLYEEEAGDEREHSRAYGACAGGI